MNVSLAPQLEERVRAKVASGLCSSAREAVREAPHLIDEQDRLRAARLEQLRDDIHQGSSGGQRKTWSAEDARGDGRSRRARKAP